MGHNFFSTGNFAFFSKTCVFNNHLYPKKCCHKFHCNCQESFWTLISCFLRFITLENTRKKGKKNVIAKTAFFELFFSVDLSDPQEMILSFAQDL